MFVYTKHHIKQNIPVPFGIQCGFVYLYAAKTMDGDK